MDSLLLSDRDDFADEVEIDSLGADHFTSAGSSVGSHGEHWIDESVRRCLLDVGEDFVDVRSAEIEGVPEEVLLVFAESANASLGFDFVESLEWWEFTLAWQSDTFAWEDAVHLLASRCPTPHRSERHELFVDRAR